MTCPRCIHWPGEHHLCLDHGGKSGFLQAAYKRKPEPVPVKVSWDDLSGPEWDFLDEGPKVEAEAIP